MMNYELVIDEAGTCTLTLGGEVMWVSDADDDFAEAFPDALIEYDDEEQTGEVIDWLMDEGYIPPGAPVDVVADDSAETGAHRTLDADDEDDEEDDEDEDV
jgi:hypothetical protein